MASWVVQLITLTGVAVGALASFISTSSIDRRRWRQDQVLRLNAERLECYSQFASSIERYIDFAYHTSAGLGLPTEDHVYPLDSDTGVASLGAARAELNGHFQRIQMIGGPNVIAAAAEYQRQAWRLEGFARGRFDNPEDFTDATKSRRNARRHFYSEVRAELGVVSNKNPEGDITRPRYLNTPSNRNTSSAPPVPPPCDPTTDVRRGSAT